MSFIHNQILPWHIGKLFEILDWNLISCKNDVELFVIEMQFCSFLLGSGIFQHLNLWCKSLKFVVPIGQGQQGNDNQKWAIYTIFYQVTQKRNALQRLTQPHFVSQYTIETIFVQCHQPLQSIQLVIFQCTSWYYFWLCHGMRGLRFLNCLSCSYCAIWDISL